MGLARQIRQNIIFRGIFFLFQFLNTLLISRLAGPSGFGLYSLVNVNAQFLLLLTSLGLPSGILFHASSKDADPRWLVRISWLSTLAQVAVIAVLEWLFRRSQGHYFVWNDTSLWIGLSGLIFAGTIILTEKYYALYNGYGYLLTYHKVLAGFNLLFFACLVLSARRIGGNVQPVIQIMILVQLLQLMFLMTWLARQMPKLPRVAGRPGASLWWYASTAFVSNLLYYLLTRIDLWMVEGYQGGYALGLYALPVRLWQMLLILPSLMASIVLPGIVSDALTAKPVERLFRILNTVNIAIGLAATLFAPWLIPVFFGKDFSESGVIVLFLMPGIICLSAQVFLAAYFAGKGQLRVNLYSMAIGTVIALVLYRLWIPAIGIRGAAIASTLGYSASFLFIYYRYCRQTGYVWWHIIVRNHDLAWLRSYLFSKGQGI